jgi:hypothetical protein
MRPSSGGSGPSGDGLAALVARFTAEVLPLAEELRAADGPDPAGLRRLAAAVRALPAGDLPAAPTIADDLDRWADDPAAPDFEASREAIRPPGHGRCGVYVGPVFLPNSGSRAANLEAFLVLHDEPPAFDELRPRFPYDQPTCQPVRLLAGTPGVAAHNNVVFFPENIPAASRCTRQRFAWFFFSKHTSIWPRTLGLVERATGAPAGTSPFAGEDGLPLASAGLGAEDVYAARSVWGYLHDHFHQTGLRPLHEHLAMKTTWASGAVEELRVDTRSAVACVDEPVPHGAVVHEYVLLERMFRYPAEPDAPQNADAASGVAMAGWLAREGALSWREDGTVALGTRAEVVDGLRSLAGRLDTVERAPVGEHEAVARRVLDDLLDGGLDPSGTAFRFPAHRRPAPALATTQD